MSRAERPRSSVMMPGNSEMTRWLACAHVSNEDVLGGAFAGEIEALCAQPLPAPPPMDGARPAAERILAAV